MSIYIKITMQWHHACRVGALAVPKIVNESNARATDTKRNTDWKVEFAQSTQLPDPHPCDNDDIGIPHS